MCAAARGPLAAAAGPRTAGGGPAPAAAASTATATACACAGRPGASAGAGLPAIALKAGADKTRGMHSATRGAPWGATHNHAHAPGDLSQVLVQRDTMTPGSLLLPILGRQLHDWLPQACRSITARGRGCCSRGPAAAIAALLFLFSLLRLRLLLLALLLLHLLLVLVLHGGTLLLLALALALCTTAHLHPAHTRMPKAVTASGSGGLHFVAPAAHAARAAGHHQQIAHAPHAHPNAHAASHASHGSQALHGYGGEAWPARLVHRLCGLRSRLRSRLLGSGLRRCRCGLPACRSPTGAGGGGAAAARSCCSRSLG